MKVKILKDQLYKGFGESASARQAGEVVDFPSWYAERLIEMGWAEAYVEPKPKHKAKPKAKPRKG